MSVSQLFTYVSSTINEHSTLLVILFFVIISLIQITPIKLNPWTAFGKLLKLIGRWFSKDTLDKLSEMEKKIDDVASAVDNNEIDRLRWEIIMFSNSCQRGINHTQREFEHVFKLNRKYHGILDRVGKENGEIDREIEYLEHLDAEKKEHDSYLK